jgi:hypothetical protein
MGSSCQAEVITAQEYKVNSQYAHSSLALHPCC